MEPDRFDSVVRALFTTPSRRAVSRALASLALGSLLAPRLSTADVDAKKGHSHGKHHKHKEKKKKNKRKKQVSDRCPKVSTFCQNPNESAAGQLSGCCSTQTDGEGNPAEVCTDCGCCPYNESTCCRGGLYGLCCASGSQCSQSADFQNVACCSATDKVCFGGCCEANDVCCTMNDGTPYCCSGEEGLTCKKSNGPTCVKA